MNDYLTKVSTKTPQLTRSELGITQKNKNSP